VYLRRGVSCKHASPLGACQERSERLRRLSAACGRLPVACRFVACCVLSCCLLRADLLHVACRFVACCVPICCLLRADWLNATLRAALLRGRPLVAA
jgi:hypothetical protein